MKVCKKCKNEYKEDYIYCPRCGRPYDDNMKKVKTPTDVKGSAASILLLIWNIILYVIGSIIAFVLLITIVEMPIASIIGVLFGLSLFPIFYKIIEDKTNINKGLLIAIRIVLPFILFIIMLVAVPDTTKKDDVKKESYYCLQEDKDGIETIEGLNYSYMFNHYTMENNLLDSEVLIKYKFDTEESAYNYYTQKINDWSDYEVNLLEKEILMYKKEEGLKDRDLKSIVSLQEKIGGTCKTNDNYMIKKFDYEYAIFTSNKDKAKEYLESKTPTENTNENNDQETAQNNSKATEPAYMDALRKCTVMEAADIDKTGSGKEGVSNFYTAKNTCELWYKEFGEKEFINIVETDWKDRQNEYLGAQPLTHYLETLNW